jgi:hypothetical protein
MPKAACANCGAEFASSTNRLRYCSSGCYQADLRKRNAETLVARFWDKVEKSSPSACWLWTAAQIRGYGQFHLGRDGAKQYTVYAHRYAWTITNGPIPDNLQVCHRCDVPLCCNPLHMFLGTQQDNMTDARQRGRLVDGQHLIKVDDAGIRDILQNYRPRINGKQLAAKYGITLVSLMRFVNGTARVVPTAAMRKSA